MALGGYANRIAHIDLTTGSVEVKPIPEEWALKYIGARGLGVRYLLENGPTVDPVSPENLLCFMNGPLTGTAANMSGRLAIVTKSPLTGTVTDSHQGGWSAARLRWAGFDGLAIQGKAETPVYLFVGDGKIEIRDASDVWGKGVHDTIRHFQQKYGEKDLTVMAIGPAGENQVRYAAWINENDRASGRGGTGCVGGSKHLKAVVVKAQKKLPEPREPGAWKPAHKRALATIMDEKNVTSPRKGGLSVFGTNVLMNITSTMGALPAHNSRETSFGDGAEKIAGEYVNEHLLVDNPTCHACPVACKKEVEIKEGPFAGLRMESFEYEPAWSLGANCGNDDAPSIAKMIDMANDYGMDAIEIGGVLATYMEATDKGYAQEKGDAGLKWADIDGMIETIRRITFREGIGDVLANGVSPTAAHFGHPEIGMHVKNQGLPAYDPRGLKGMGIAYATSNRGACHLRAYTPASELGLIPLKTDPLAWEGKGELTKTLQDLHAFSDSLDLCKFSAFAEGAEEYAAQYGAMTGRAFTVDDVLTTGERIYNLERRFNNLAGFREGSDTLPERYQTEASTMPGSKGHVCELDQMLEEYYRVRGWRDGVVPDEKLKELEVI
ncbi:MAG: aldehyde ferredoxin oxidoreductase family protein [Planctomycetota bacterium]|jgi:aldehyde:ferredoxin oxidoreductase